MSTDTIVNIYTSVSVFQFPAVNHHQTLERRYLGIIGGGLLDLLKVRPTASALERPFLSFLRFHPNLIQQFISIKLFWVFVPLSCVFHRDCVLPASASLGSYSGSFTFAASVLDTGAQCQECGLRWCTCTSPSR